MDTMDTVYTLLGFAGLAVFAIIFYLALNLAFSGPIARYGKKLLKALLKGLGWTLAGIVVVLFVCWISWLLSTVHGCLLVIIAGMWWYGCTRLLQ